MQVENEVMAGESERRRRSMVVCSGAVFILGLSSIANTLIGISVQLRIDRLEVDAAVVRERQAEELVHPTNVSCSCQPPTPSSP